jgi:hypothetical protein
MSNQFLQADVGRDIVSQGGLGTITGYTSATQVTVEIKQDFPATQLETGTWAMLGSPQTTCTPGASGPAGSPTTLTLSIAGWRPEDVGKFVRINGGLCRITAYTSSLAVDAIIEIALSSPVAAPALSWTLEGAMWSTAYGWPRCGCIHEQRLWLGGSPTFPKMFWGSAIGGRKDFTLGVDDDEGLAYSIGSGQFVSILHMTTADGLVIYTDGAEYSVRGGQEKPITPTNIRVRRQSAYGSSIVPPVEVGSEQMMIQRAGRKVRAVSPSQFDSDKFYAPDVSVLAEHVTESGIVRTAYQAEPDPVMYLVRADGQMATLTPDRDQEVFAFSRQVTQGNYESVCVVPTPTGARVFVVVARYIGGVLTRYIETFEPGLHTDSAITGTSESGATIWGGLAHLAGRTVIAKGDGVYLGEFEVGPGDQITLPRAAKSVEIGLQYTTTVKTLTPEFMTQTGSSQGAQLAADAVKVRLFRTVGCSINLQQIAFRKFGDNILDKPPPVFTGDKKATNLGWGDGLYQTLIQQTLPYDFHLLSVITSITANSG